jgi:hypothetical protein
MTSSFWTVVLSLWEEGHSWSPHDVAALHLDALNAILSVFSSKMSSVPHAESLRYALPHIQEPLISLIACHARDCGADKVRSPTARPWSS